MVSRMTTTADILKLAEEYADAECQATRRSHVDPSIERDALRTAVESLVAERDALRDSLKWAMSEGRLTYRARTKHNGDYCDAVDAANAALRGQP